MVGAGTGKSDSETGMRLAVYNLSMIGLRLHVSLHDGASREC